MQEITKRCYSPKGFFFFGVSGRSLEGRGGKHNTCIFEIKKNEQERILVKVYIDLRAVDDCPVKKVKNRRQETKNELEKKLSLVIND